MYKDGCSGGMSSFWRAAFKTPPPWEGCCDEHDMAYEKGGPLALKTAADMKLFNCVKARGYLGWAFIMYFAVAIFGNTSFALTNRWGYGVKFDKHGSE